MIPHHRSISIASGIAAVVVAIQIVAGTADAGLSCCNCQIDAVQDQPIRAAVAKGDTLFAAIAFALGSFLYHLLVAAARRGPTPPDPETDVVDVLG